MRNVDLLPAALGALGVLVAFCAVALTLGFLFVKAIFKIAREGEDINDVEDDSR